MKRPQVLGITVAVLLVISTGISFPQEASVEDGAASGQIEPRQELPAEDTLFFGGAEAAEDTAEADQAPQLDSFGVWDLLRMVLVLIMVVGAVYGVVSFLRKRVPLEEDDTDSPIRILASRTLGPRQDIHVVMIGKSVIVLGGSDTGLQLITRIEDQESVDELLLAHSTASPVRGRTFGAVFSRWVGNLTVPGAAKGHEKSVSPGSELAFLKSQQDRLRNLR